MEIGYIGLGKMGLNMVKRLVSLGHDVVATNRSKSPINEAIAAGATGVDSMLEVVQKLESRRTIWIMVPSSAVGDILEELTPLLNAGDTVIDGGNSFYQDSVRRSQELKEKGINYLDVGVSGGPEGALNGASIMVGGDKDIFTRHEKLFSDLSVPDGYSYMGQSGAGHFVKMVHNGIEYGMMQSIAEGFTLLDAAPLDLDLNNIAKVYSHGSVIDSRLIDLLAKAFEEDGVALESVSGKVSMSGEGEWTVKTARKLGTPVDVIKKSVKFRKKTQKRPNYTGKILSAIRKQFGGHDVSKK
jgi:6-phosphogluconate dehydrogenase